MKKIFEVTSIETTYYLHYIEADSAEEAEEILLTGSHNGIDLEWIPNDGVDWHISKIQEMESDL